MAELTIGAQRYPVILPKLVDPRLHLASVIITLQVLGQTVLGFDLSIAQIFMCVGTCAALDFFITFTTQRVVMWPASALLTGNGVAFILRVPGTEHGDWWSTRGAPIFISISALSILSKHVLRVGNRHIFNPSNIGLVIGFVILGSDRADPQDLWWGPMSVSIAVTLTIIVVGGLIITSRQRLLGIAAAFYVSLGIGAGIIASTGHCITARWSSEPVCGGSYWWVLMTSPEILVFCFFMITDPRTIPAGRAGRVVHGMGVAALACLFIAQLTTEFSTKVAILGALVVVCIFRPLIDRLVPEEFSFRAHLGFVPVASATVSVAIVGVSIGLLSAGTDDVAPLAGAAVEAVDGRPAIKLADDAVPAVVIGESAKRVQPPITAERADLMGRDLVESLAIAASATDPSVLATVATGPWLTRAESELSDGQLTDYQFTSLTVVLIRDPLSPQSPPQLGVKAVGTATGVGGGESDTAGPFKGTFVMVPAGTHFVISDLVV